MNSMMKKYIELALYEDIYTGDITTDSLELFEKEGKAEIMFKENGILCGIDILKEVYFQIDKDIKINNFFYDAHYIEKGDIVVEISGKLSSILKGERVALNFMQRMSGISTKAFEISKLFDNNIKIVDTRKTTPNFRTFEKYAVKTGGLFNHRMGLYDCVMIKDNHIKAAGSIKNAISKIKHNISFTTKIEVEVRTEKQFLEALENGADIIMLDNMSNEMIKKISDIERNNVLIEVSGNITVPRIKELKNYDIDIISMGCLTYSYRSIDISMNII